MKKLLTLLLTSMLLYGCSIDESGILGRLDDLEDRVSKLEELCNQMNTNISSLQTIVAALQNNDYITSVTPITENGEEIGYTITFAKSNPITIYHGQDGKDGANGTDGKDGIDGEDGADGKDGVDGKDGYSPVIGVRQDSDGIYYWTLDGEWLLDDDGNKIKAVGTDGKDGQNGQDGADGNDGADGENGKDGVDGTDGKDGVDGKDGITPQLKIEEGYWYISYDNGATWTMLGKATGEDGADGKDGVDGKDGADGSDGVNGVDGNSFFTSVDTSDENYVIFTLTDGTEIKIPTWYAFEELKKLCNQMNTNISSLQAIVEALQNNDYITAVTPITENGTEIGYTITFAKSNPITIYHGKDGIDGSNGVDGENGKDGHTPVIGVRQDTDGIYYWTLDGEWLLDENGNKIKAVGTDGKDGQDGVDGNDGADGENGKDGQDGTDGSNGEDGITPQLKIEDGYWFVSYDKGTTWTKLGKATGENGQDGIDGADGQDGTNGKDGDSMFKEIKQDENNVYFVLVDGTEIVVPKQKELSIAFSDSDIGILAGKSATIDYVIAGATDKTVVKAFGQGGWYAKVSPATNSTGTITVTAPGPLIEDEIIVLVNDGEYRSIMTSINFVTGVIIPSITAIEFEEEGSSKEMQIETNLEYEIKIPAEAASWLSVTKTQTKAMRTDNITITCTANESSQRSAIITITDLSGNEISSFSVIQYPEQEAGTLINGRVKLAEAGTLATVLGDQMLTLTSLKIIGEINSDDIRCIRQMSTFITSFDETTSKVTYIEGGLGALTDLDLSEAQIVEGGEPYFTYIDDNGTTKCKTSKNVISEYMFAFTYIQMSESDYRSLKIKLPQNIAGFCKRAFFNSLAPTNLTLPDGMTVIEDGVFENSKGLTNIIIPNGVTSIGDNAFYGCGLTYVTIPNSVTTIGRSSFAGNDLTSLTIPNSVTTLGEGAFGANDFTSVNIPESVTTISSSLFYLCIYNHRTTKTNQKYPSVNL